MWIDLAFLMKYTLTVFAVFSRSRHRTQLKLSSVNFYIFLDNFAYRPLALAAIAEAEQRKQKHLSANNMSSWISVKGAVSDLKAERLAHRTQVLVAESTGCGVESRS